MNAFERPEVVASVSAGKLAKQIDEVPLRILFGRIYRFSGCETQEGRPFYRTHDNIFAILGLRALYFVLAGVMDRFYYLNVGLALVLAFVGAKMLLTGLYAVPIGVSLAAVATLLLGSVLASLMRSPPAAQVPASDVISPVEAAKKVGTIE